MPTSPARAVSRRCSTATMLLDLIKRSVKSSLAVMITSESVSEAKRRTNAESSPIHVLTMRPRLLDSHSCQVVLHMLLL